MILENRGIRIRRLALVDGGKLIIMNVRSTELPSGYRLRTSSEISGRCLTTGSDVLCTELNRMAHNVVRELRKKILKIDNRDICNLRKAYRVLAQEDCGAAMATVGRVLDYLEPSDETVQEYLK